MTQIAATMLPDCLLDEVVEEEIWLVAGSDVDCAAEHLEPPIDAEPEGQDMLDPVVLAFGEV